MKSRALQLLAAGWELDIITECLGVHCPRAGPGRVEAIFADPDPDPQGQATLSLALAPGRLDPGPVGSGRGRVRVDPDPLIFSSELKFFFQML